VLPAPVIPKLRVARPTNDIAALRKFYMEALCLSELYAFAQHAGFDGLIVGHPQAPYYLEFTSQLCVFIDRALTPEHLLVFYYLEQADWEAAAGPWPSAHTRA